MHIQTFTLFVIKFYLSRNTSLLNTSLEEDDERFHSPIETKDPEERKKLEEEREKQRREESQKYVISSSFLLPM